jgi:simple sugar transport system ATP-binding protein
MDDSAPALELIGIEKSFGAIHASRGISISFAPGSIHGVIGENGAGKSTLMSIAYGMQRPDAGEIRIGGKSIALTGPQDAIAAGIVMVHQYFMLIDRFTVLENVMLGTEPSFGIGRALSAARRELTRLGQAYGLDLPPDKRIRDLTMGERQGVEILKALYRKARILILDEPTSVLSPPQTARLFEILRKLRDAGGTVIFISHKLGEIMELTDRVTVLRHGAVVGQTATAGTSQDSLAGMMIGDKVNLGRIGGPAQPGELLLEGRALTVRDRRGIVQLHGVDLKIREGEIVAVAGVAGNGQSEFIQALAGLLPLEPGGEIRWRGRPLERGECNPAALRALGIAHVPEDSRRFGLVAAFSAAESSILGHHDRPLAADGFRLNRQAIAAACRTMMDDFDVRPPDPRKRTGSFSGGNQQKLLLAREFGQDPDLLLIAEPTQGVDIGAVAAIQARLADLRRRGKAVLLVTSDLDQMRALADRIVVISGGKIVGQVSPEAASDTKLGLMMGGVAEART